MKLINISGLLLVAVVFNMQSMEEVPDYPLETQLFDGVISAQNYLLRLEEVLARTSKKKYSVMLRRLRTVYFHRAIDDCYGRLKSDLQHSADVNRDEFVHSLNEFTQSSEEDAALKKKLIGQMHEIVLQQIQGEYRNMLDCLRDGRAKRLLNPSESGG